MTAAAKTTFANELWMCPAGGTLVKIGELKNIEPPVAKRGMQDVTTHDSVGGAEEKIADGTYYVGDVKFDGLEIANNATNIALRLAMTTGAKQDYAIVNKAAAGMWRKTGSGFLAEFGPDKYDIKGVQMFKGMIESTGAITEAAVA